MERFIPTPVGNIPSLHRANTIYTVHPHACGEHMSLPPFGKARRGSSPRLWGTFYHLPTVTHPTRFIPTPVGNIRAASITPKRWTVHPHACGEHFARCVRFPPSFRFIPTPVGNMSHACWPLPIRPVHPHACGEHLGRNSYAQPTSGSSPRLWGTFYFDQTGWRPRRFIPTPVGNIISGETVGARCAVHPHACGEHYIRRNGWCSMRGSSPRLWGTFSNCRETSETLRFIPTPVGNISPQALAWSRRSVHPHACGEHAKRRD